MKKILICLILSPFPTAAFAAPSGIDVQEIKGRLESTCEELDNRLDWADSAYRQLMSTQAITAEAYAGYHNGLAETGEEIKNLAEYQKNLSEAVEKLEKSEPRPDDMRELLELNAYAAGTTEAVKARYEEARRKLEHLVEQMEKRKRLWICLMQVKKYAQKWV